MLYGATMNLTDKSNADLRTLHEWAAAQYEAARKKFDQAAHAREDAWVAVETIANEIERRAEGGRISTKSEFIAGDL